MNYPTSTAARRCYRFGPFIADARKRLLWREGRPVSVTPKALEILAVLLENSGRVVAKDEIVNRVWGGAAVEDATLARHISTLRRALDERPDQHLYIVTVPGHGYEFVAATVEVEEGLPHPGAAPPTPGTIIDAEELAPLPAASTQLPPAISDVLASKSGTPSRWRWSRAAAASAIVALAAMALLVWRLDFRRGASPATQRALRQFTFHGGLGREPAWSPDGRLVAYTSEASGNSDIWVQAASDPRPVRVTTSPAEDSQPVWSPDGLAIVFRSERDAGGLYVVPSTGGTERRLTTFGYRPRWSLDGRFLLFSSSAHQGGTNPLYFVDATGGTPRQLRPDLLSGVDVIDAAWTPDGSGVSVWGRRNQEETFLTFPLEGGQALASARLPLVDEQIRKAQVSLGYFTWSPSGKHLFFEGTAERVRNVWRVTVDPKTREWTAGPERLTTGAGQDADITVSPDGSRMVFSTRLSRTRVWTFPFDPAAGRIGGEGKPVTSGGAGEQDVDAPRDGTKVVYTAVRGNRQELWERTLADGRERLLISATEWRRTRPRWSPDGLRLAYRRTRTTGTGTRDEAVAVLPAGGEEQLLTVPGEISLVPTDWSTDGNWLLGTCQVGTPRRVGSCVIPVSPVPQSAADMRVVASDPALNLFESRFSPDQRWVTFVAVDTSDARVSTIFVVPAAGGPWRPITEGTAYDDKPHWSRDGRTLFFVSNREGVFNVWGRHVDPGRGTPLGASFRVTTFTSPRFTLSADLPRTQIAVTATNLFLPITETAGELWMLDGVDR